MRSQAGAAIGRRPFLRFRPRNLTSAALGALMCNRSLNVIDHRL